MTSEIEKECERYIAARIDALDRLVHQRLQDMQRSHDNFFTEVSRRFEEHNRFREQILNERADFMTRDTAAARDKEINQALKNIEDFVANLKGRIWSIGVGAAIGTALLSTIVSIIIKYLP